jgi:hypothetical protein
MKDQHSEAEFMETLKKLVDHALWRVPRFSLTAIGDIFNAIGERIERWKDI